MLRLNKFTGNFYKLFDNLFNFRQTVGSVKENGTRPSVALAKLQESVRSSFPADSINALQALPKRNSVLQTFSNKRKLTQLEDFDPLAPPEKIFVKTF